MRTSRAGSIAWREGPEDLVFTGAKGAVLRLSHFRRSVFIPAVEATGLTGLTPDGLRHTAASLAIASGADVKVVQTMSDTSQRPRRSTATAISTPTARRNRRSDGRGPHCPFDQFADVCSKIVRLLRTNGQLIKLPISADGLEPSKPGPSSVERATGIEPAPSVWKSDPGGCWQRLVIMEKCLQAQFYWSVGRWLARADRGS